MIGYDLEVSVLDLPKRQYQMFLLTYNAILLKLREMRLIFELGTLKPKGLNISFSFI